jgi:hypothetical protein
MTAECSCQVNLGLNTLLNVQFMASRAKTFCFFHTKIAAVDSCFHDSMSYGSCLQFRCSGRHLEHIGIDFVLCSRLASACAHVSVCVGMENNQVASFFSFDGSVLASVIFAIVQVDSLCLFAQRAMSDDPGTHGASSARPPAAPASAKAEAKASTRSKKAARPKIDLDEEIRRANDLAAMSRKMLSVAKQTSKNNRKAKQRLIKKAGKLSPEDLERIAVLKRCGLFQEEDQEAEDAADDADQTETHQKTPLQSGPSEAEAKRKKLGDALELLAGKHSILDELGLRQSVSSSSGASSSADGRSPAVGKKGGPPVLAARRLPRVPSFCTPPEDSQKDDDIGAED